VQISIIEQPAGLLDKASATTFLLPLTNVTRTGKTNRSDQFTGLAGSNWTFKLLLTGSIWNWFFLVFFLKLANSVQSSYDRKSEGICKFKKEKRKKERDSTNNF
jgi:hypothetical protein